MVVYGREELGSKIVQKIVRKHTRGSGRTGSDDRNGHGSRTKRGATQRRKGRYHRPDGEGYKIVEGSTGRRVKSPEYIRLVGVVAPPPVASKNATSTGEEADEECDEGTKS